jgi:hypothetical protein
MELYLDDAAKVLKDRSASGGSWSSPCDITVQVMQTADYGRGEDFSYRTLRDQEAEVTVYVTGKEDIARVDALKDDATQAVRRLYEEFVVRALVATPAKYGLIVACARAEGHIAGRDEVQFEIRLALGLER